MAAGALYLRRPGRPQEKPWSLSHPFAFISLLLLTAAPRMSGQVTGNISGYVKDASRAAVPGATVTALMAEQTFSRTAQSNSQGLYSLVGLLPGHYQLTLEAKGFASVAHPGHESTVAQQGRVIQLVLKFLW